MIHFIPDYRNLLDAAHNIEPKRLPLYEHIVSVEIMEQALGKPLAHLAKKETLDLDEYYRNFCRFFVQMGYDTVSFERCICEILPDSGALYSHREGVIQDQADFDKYPWDDVPDLYFRENAPHFEALRKAMPAGMRAVGGAGNGVFECVQDLVGFESLCYISVDDPELYARLFAKVGEVLLKIWARLLREYGDLFCVCRFGDDLGFKSSTMLAREDVIKHIVPQYAKIVAEVHSYHKPFILHSCGCIFDVMDEIINVAKIDGKHSNEDQIAPFPVWVERYGDKIGNFGGIDTDAVCRLDRAAMKEYITDVVTKCKGHGGFAFGSGNSIPNYVPFENYRNMTEIVREIRGDYK